VRPEDPPKLDGSPASVIRLAQWLVTAVANEWITTKEAEVFEKVGRLSLAGRKQKHAETEIDELRKIEKNTAKNLNEAKELIRNARKQGIAVDTN